MIWPTRPRFPGAVAGVIERLGKIDALVNCAGTVTGRFQSLLDMEEDNWDFVQTVNLKAAMLMMKHVAKHMIERGGGGRIVNISSSSAFRARQSPIAYASSKAALVQLTRSAAAELGPHNINDQCDCARDYRDRHDQGHRRCRRPGEGSGFQWPPGKPVSPGLAAGRCGGRDSVSVSAGQPPDHRPDASYQRRGGGVGSRTVLSMTIIPRLRAE